ncbi:CinA family protein [Adhaeribacter soli]|uniref:CinA family protein n=1 Tax=Adhaeribacter soli TaxID=2607655 RepID=A0A5N1ILG5_9BACT|nr:CinA family protein [Adhaeribacter soli]KAA9327297.1 CinA family protein [Adhaeribacter soli]
MKVSDISRIVQKLQSQGLTVAFAESCTAGLLASEFVKGKGTGSVLLGSIVTYNEMVKQTLLGVKKQTISLYTCESQQVTNEMVMGLHKLLKADISVAVTGLADSGASESEDKPVGTVFFSVYYKGKVDEFREEFDGTTEQIRKQAVEFIFQKLEDIHEKHFS